MASKVFDTSELDAFAKSLGKSSGDLAKKQKPFLRKEGTKLRGATVKVARQRVGRKTGNYLKSIKRGKVYRFKDADTLAVRCYSTAPHAHLIEEGHRIVTPGGREVGFAPGHHVFEVAGKGFEPTFLADIDDMLDEVVRKL